MVAQLLDAPAAGEVAPVEGAYDVFEPRVPKNYEAVLAASSGG
jgi:hypothetical protein